MFSKTLKKLDISAELDEKNEQVKSLTERLQQITSKLYESKNAYTTLKQDFNKAQKVFRISNFQLFYIKNPKE